MKHKAEIFDQVQYLFQEKKMNDHTLHFEMVCNTRLDIARMKEAIWIVFQEIPILSCNYLYENNLFFWEKKQSIRIKDILTVTQDEEVYQSQFLSAVPEKKAPQLRLCYLQKEFYKLGFTLNHMVSDAAGFKEILYFFCDCYNKGELAIKFIDIRNTWRNRDLRGILDSIPMERKLKSITFESGHVKPKDTLVYPMSLDMPIEPLICKKNIGRYMSQKIGMFAKKKGVTVNDIFCTAYIRVVSNNLEKNEKEIAIPIMVDMRKYKKKEKEISISNQTSMESISCVVYPEESFADTLKKVSSQIREKKKGFMGLSTFVFLQILFSTFGEKYSYKILRKKMTNSKIAMTNIGILDDKRLRLDGIEILEALLCGSIKYRPYIQIAISTYQEQMVLSCNLYGSKENKKEIKKILDGMEKELQQIV